MEENTEESLTMMLTILLMILSPMILDLVKECCGTILRILRNLAPLLTLGASSRRRTPKKSTDVSGMRSLKEPRFSTRRSRHRQLRHGGIDQHSTLNSLLRHRHRHRLPASAQDNILKGSKEFNSSSTTSNSSNKFHSAGLSTHQVFLAERNSHREDHHPNWIFKTEFPRP